MAGLQREGGVKHVQLSSKQKAGKSTEAQGVKGVKVQSHQILDLF
jgi:hypothetical protein